MTQTAKRPLTAADLAALPTRLPSGPVRYELREGELRVMAPPGDEHGAVVFTITLVIGEYGQQQGHGRGGCGDVGILLQRHPDTVVGADAVFQTRDQLPPRRSREGYLETIPALIVEVRSKNDTDAEVAQKVADYLAAGARAVWVADPGRRTLTVYRRDELPAVLGVGDTLTAEGIIPGFAVPVAKLFEGLD
jgi:Uma2 family endonuclease